MYKLTLWQKLRRNTRFTWQIWKRGWCDSQCWNLQDSIYEFLSSRLRVFWNQINDAKIAAIPGGLSTEEWLEIVWKMVRAFDLLEMDAAGEIKLTDKDWKEITEGCELFHKWLHDLWW